MKRIFTTKKAILVASALFSLPVCAQKKLTEGTIFYDITISTESDKPQNGEFLNGTTVVYLKPGKSRSEMVSSLGTQTTIVTQTPSNKEITILKEFGPQKYIINLTPADWTEINKKYENVSFTYDPSATKSIQGYTAKKAIGRLADSTTFIVWYTPDILVDSKDFQYANRALPGLALEYEANYGNLKIIYTASKVSFAPVPASKFELPKAGFRVMTYQESKGKKN